MRNLDNIGLSGSLIVTTDYDPDSAIDGSIVDSGASRVSVIQPSDFPDVENAKLVPSNLESFNFIHPTYTYLSDDVAALPLSSRNCYSRDEITVRFFHEYSKSDCDLLCEVEEIERRCHCLMIYVPHVKTKLACNTTDINCIISVKTKYSEWFNEEKCHCPRDCSSFEYRIEATLGNLLSVRQIAHNMYGYLNLNKSSTILHFNIPRTVYVRQRQETVMSLITLCSNLGGVFGLCMGCSAVSLFEILYYLYIAIKMRMENKRTRRMRKGAVHPYFS
ncbi:sodium channel protein Nach-like [Colias croceus]|uniref:sodium channel protein Nach-like n=1 Tax=Colias crocea TaxID=72248 RepID=UPI001E27F0D3|nr:sodium channel protein Nach-like [Colias croceus]